VASDSLSKKHQSPIYLVSAHAAVEVGQGFQLAVESASKIAFASLKLRHDAIDDSSIAKTD